MTRRAWDPAKRKDVALQATWQIDKLFEALFEQSREGGPLHGAVTRALAIRGKALASAVMSMLDDEIACVDDAQRIVDGSRHGRDLLPSSATQ